MKAHQDYQSLVGKYKGGTQLIKKLGLSAICIQAGIFGFIHGWKHLHIGHYNLAAPILFSLSIYIMIKDFFPYRRIDRNMTGMILEGLELERKHSGFGNLFHDVLKNFNVVWTVLQRSAVDLAVLWLFGNLMYTYIFEVNLNFVMSRWLFNLWMGVISIFLVTQYYEPFKALLQAKAKILAK